MNDKDGGSAFPVPMVSDGNAVGDVNERGMSLRDYFAGQALIASMASPRWVEGLDISATRNRVTFAAALAHMAYQYADAMLTERSKGAEVRHER